MPIKKQVVKNSNKRGAERANVKTSAGDKGHKMVSFGRAVSNFFRKYFQFNGVATRAEYWWAMLFVFVSVIGLLLLAWGLQPINMLVAGFVAMLWLVFCVVIIVPVWSVMARRLHDAGFTAKLLYVNLVFLVYSMLVPGVISGVAVIEWMNFIWGIIILILSVLPSKRQNNPYRD